MRQGMVTFDSSSWVRKEEAFRTWSPSDLERAVSGLEYSVDEVIRFYRNDVRNLAFAGRRSRSDFTLVPQDAVADGRFARFGFYDITIAPGDDRDRALKLLSAFAYAFLRVRPYEHPEMIITAASRGAFSDDGRSLPVLLEEISVVVPGQLEMFSADTPALPEAPAIEVPRKIVRGFEVIQGGRRVRGSQWY